MEPSAPRTSPCMKFQSIVAAGVAALVLFVSPALGVAQTPVSSPGPVRHLVYSFTWGTTNNTETHVSGMQDSGNAMGSMGGSASGVVNESAGTSEKGTITVDVLREQPDRGLVVSISEQARDVRSAVAATCVVFGNTTVVCDQSAKINAEELTLLRFLGANFVDPNQLDAKQHWQVSQGDNDYVTTANYTIGSNAAGIMKISEDRIVKESKSKTNTIETQILYDFNRQIPTAITEYSIERRESGEQYTTFKTETVLDLQSDSLAGKS
jgi:co-chaperonin GroES (HSP10)